MTLVFFFPVILRDSHRHIFAMDKLEQDGNRIVILDATEYYKIYHRTTTDQFLIDRMVACKTKSDFSSFRSSLEEEQVIFVSDNLHMKMCYEVLNIIISNKDRLIVSSTRFTPAHYKYPAGFEKLLVNFINFGEAFLPFNLFKKYYSNYKKVYVPDYFLGATEFLTPINIKLSVKPSNRIFVHADDINYAFEPQSNSLDSSKKVGVFLDQMLPYFNGRNPDVHNKEVNKEYKKTYYSNLVGTLKKLKKEFDLDEIVIALHPEAKTIKEEIDSKFYPFPTAIDMTHEIIKDSQIVFGHFSTSLNIAAFYKKPIILLTDNNMLQRSDRRGFITSYSNELQLKKINIDEDQQKVSKDDLEIDNDLYDLYIKKFLKEIPYQGNAMFYAINKVKKELVGKQNKLIGVK